MWALGGVAFREILACRQKTAFNQNGNNKVDNIDAIIEKKRTGGIKGMFKDESINHLSLPE